MKDDPGAVDAGRLDEMLAQVDGLRDRINRLTPQRGSLAADDFDHRNVLRRLAWQHGTVGLSVACDCMRGLRLMAGRTPRPVFAHLPLLRASLEGASMARWLFDPSASAEIRVQRGLRAELSDLAYLQYAEGHGAGGTAFPALRKSAEPALERLQLLRNKWHVEPAPVEEMRPSRLAARYASFPDGGASSGGWLYSVLSAATHGRRWALEMTNARERNPLDPLTLVRASVDLPRVVLLSAIVLDHLEVACQSAERYAGFGEPG